LILQRVTIKVIARCLVVLGSQRLTNEPRSSALTVGGSPEETKGIEVSTPAVSRPTDSMVSTRAGGALPTYGKTRWIFFGGLVGAIVGGVVGTGLGITGGDAYVAVLLWSLTGVILSFLIVTKEKRNLLVLGVITFLSIAGWAMFDNARDRYYPVRTLVLGPLLGAVLSIIGVFSFQLWDYWQRNHRTRERDTGRVPK
jgi:hypothetical protein